jgi:two-component sensor histidine kinase
MIERQVRHMTRLVDDLLDVSRVTRGKVTLRKEPLLAADVVARAVEAIGPLVDARRHQLSVSLPARPLLLEGDATRLAQVLDNLLSNAAKYQDDGGHIWLSACQEGGEVVFRVRDQGVGIPKERLSEVFDLFTQVDSTIDRSQGGLGIGLALVRSLVQLHSGSVAVSSDGPGQGSEFTVRLPALMEVPPSPGQEAARQEVLVTSRRRVLVVDDNVDAAESLAMVLRLSGHEVRTAHEGRAALARPGSPPGPSSWTSPAGADRHTCQATTGRAWDGGVAGGVDRLRAAEDNGVPARPLRPPPDETADPPERPARGYQRLPCSEPGP